MKKKTINKAQAEAALGEYADKVGTDDVNNVLGKEDEIKSHWHIQGNPVEDDCGPHGRAHLRALTNRPPARLHPGHWIL